MKKVILFLLGVIPLVLGFLIHTWMMKNQNSVLPFKLIGIIFLLFWVWVGFITCKFERTPLKSAIIANSLAFLMLLFILFQEIILGRYGANMFGIVPQLYYLPLVNISSSIVGLLYSLMGWGMQVSVISLMSFLFMFGSYYLGSYFKKQKNI
ncbi:hypothetical protein EDC19_1820 [Natranaerovirga hydrolytica]|uniref:Uncharacterized protein n=1 Tax=Natranaerovirga hydrolytica TaxID=680378 RepID=A0A4R1MJJ4_9FIRM|nr:hypothetical protein [Natranaerovirga hydrolytica]TCK92667.1 hypothetical protein EDC19_1820 [Natranaerovirga hydrolytica]